MNNKCKIPYAVYRNPANALFPPAAPQSGLYKPEYDIITASVYSEFSFEKFKRIFRNEYMLIAYLEAAKETYREREITEPVIVRINDNLEIEIGIENDEIWTIGTENENKIDNEKFLKDHYKKLFTRFGAPRIKNINVHMITA